MKCPATRPASIRRSGRTIYDPVEVGDPDLWIPTGELESILDTALCGKYLGDRPLRTRSKDAKQLVCKALGYPVPERFRQSRPQFAGQRMDVYVQKSNNLQIWNDEIVPARRYAVVRLGHDDVVTRVRVVAGDVIAGLDTTGALTRKYQAKLTVGRKHAVLISRDDTERLRPYLGVPHDSSASRSPTADPQTGAVLPIKTVYDALRGLLGTALENVADDQDRTRGMLLQGLVCKRLGYEEADDGRFPDLRHQLLEVKLQTSPTIDLGAVLPDDTAPLVDLKIDSTPLRPCDIRYVIFSGAMYGPHLLLTHLYLTNGRRFFERFPQMQGNIVNKKLQIKLPQDFFGIRP